MRPIQKVVYTFDELNDKAKDRARDWWREASAYDNFFAEQVIEDAAKIAEILGIEFRSRAVPLMNGKTRNEPAVYFRGFSSQGDGACFEGSYSYKRGSKKAIRECAPQDNELHAIADALNEAQRGVFYSATATARHSGSYCHSGCMSVNVDVPEGKGSEAAAINAQSMIEQCLRDFADWIYKQLEWEYDYQNGNEAIDEIIRANEYEFTEDGERAA
jgi:hypothetical protein